MADHRGDWVANPGELDQDAQEAIDAMRRVAMSPGSCYFLAVFEPFEKGGADGSIQQWSVSGAGLPVPTILAFYAYIIQRAIEGRESFVQAVQNDDGTHTKPTDG